MNLAWKVLGFAVLLLAVVGSGIAVVEARHQHRQLFIELSGLERERDELGIEFGRLQLEQATWAETHRIERIAREQLGMKYPEAADLRVLVP
jgi:cell division protein FtsL